MTTDIHHDIDPKDLFTLPENTTKHVFLKWKYL